MAQPVVFILKRENSKEVSVPLNITRYFANLKYLPKQGNKVIIRVSPLTEEMLNVVVAFYVTYIRTGSVVWQVIIPNALNEFLRYWKQLQKQPDKVIQLLWVAKHLGALELNQFLTDELKRTMSDEEIKSKLNQINAAGIGLSCDACRKKKAEYVNLTRDRFFCSYECFNEYK